MLTGEQPEALDHINRVRDDNRIENLRPATVKQNNANKVYKGNSVSNYTGVYKTYGGSWKVQISIDGKMQYLGCYNTAEDGYEAYKKKHVEVYGEYSPFYGTEIKEVAPSGYRLKSVVKEPTSEQIEPMKLIFEVVEVDGKKDVVYFPRDTRKHRHWKSIRELNHNGLVSIKGKHIPVEVIESCLF